MSNDAIPVLKPNTEGNFEWSHREDEATKKLYQAVRPSIVSIETANGCGTGFFYGSDGKSVATDLHVVNGGTQIKVTLDSGEELPARIDRVDDLNDLAILKLDDIKSGSHRGLPLGSNSSMHKNDQAFCFGHPNSVSETVFSPLRSSGKTQTLLDTYPRVLTGDEKQKLGNMVYKIPMLPLDDEHCDKAFNRPLLKFIGKGEHGESGGPVVNANGEVVGLVEAGNEERSVLLCTPVESLKALHNETNPRFQFTYDSGDDQFLPNLLKQSPLNFALGSLAAAGGLRLGFKYAPGVYSALFGLGGLAMLFPDAEQASQSPSGPNWFKSAGSTLADMAIIGAASAASVPCMRKAGLYGLAFTGLTRLALEFIPRNKTLSLSDVRRT